MMHRDYLCVAATALLAPLFCVSQRASADTKNQLFVERAYHDLLGRLPDETGLAGFANALDQNTQTTAQVADSITGGAEFHSIETRQQYRALLHHDADALGLNAWVNALGGGATVEQMQSDLAGSSEYYANRAAGTDGGFLTALYSDLLGRSTSPSERAFDLAQLSGESRSTFALGILSGTEYDQRLVSGYYPRFLHRAADSASITFYVGQLQHGARDEQVISQVVGSPEYYNLPLLPGDTNFDRTVNFTDLLTLAQNYGQKNVHWFNGDFNGDNLVNFNDLLLLAQHYGGVASAATIADATVARVPDPALSTPFVAMILFAVSRKR
jgi:hypothetical protein